MAILSIRNFGNIQILRVDSNPEGISAPTNSLATVSTSRNVYRNVGGTSWQLLNSVSILPPVVPKPGSGSGSGSGGAQGAQGRVGHQGLQGLQGYQGSQGTMGTQGVQGAQGAFGYGPQGNRGPQGLQGVQGDDGVQGPQGVPGSQGATGIGAQGYQGRPGNKGEDATEPGPQGYQGPQGNTGPAGTSGTQGLQGAQGVQGAQGRVGPNGSIGPQGLQGAQGRQGSGGIGQQGSQGYDGAQGRSGSAGSQGTQGAQGHPGSDEIGAQGAQGVQSVVAGPRGYAGLIGPQGGIGPQGDTGAQGYGIPGPQGDVGAQGHQGRIGSNGLSGNTGDSNGSALILVEAKQISTGVQTVTFENLDGDSDRIYFIRGRVLRPAGSAGTTFTYSVRPNGLTTNLAYISYGGYYSTAAGSNAISTSAGSSGYLIGSSTSTTRFDLQMWISAEKTLPRLFDIAISRRVFDGSNQQFDVWRSGVRWNETTTNLTSIEINCDRSGGLAAGTELYLYKLVC